MNDYLIQSHQLIRMDSVQTAHFYLALDVARINTRLVCSFVFSLVSFLIRPEQVNKMEKSTLGIIFPFRPLLVCS